MAMTCELVTIRDTLEPNQEAGKTRLREMLKQVHVSSCVPGERSPPPPMLKLPAPRHCDQCPGRVNYRLDVLCTQLNERT